MQQPKIFDILEFRWVFIRLPGHRSFPEYRTYDRFSFENLPPIQEPLDGSYSWLLRQPQLYSHSIGLYNIPENLQQDDEVQYDFVKDHPARLLAFAAAHGIALPTAFITFITSSELYNRVRSCTDCHIELAVHPAQAVGAAAGWIIRFLVDSQGSPVWYLFIDPAGGHVVLGAREHFGFDASDMEYWASDKPTEQVDLGQANVWLCAFSFEEFMYRFWIENEIWYAIEIEHTPFDPIQQAYVDHYAGGDEAPAPL